MPLTESNLDELIDGLKSDETGLLGAIEARADAVHSELVVRLTAS